MTKSQSRFNISLAYSPQAKLSQSNTKHVEKKIKKEEEDGSPTPSSSSSHSSSQIQVEDDPTQQQPQPRPSPQLESSEDVHDTKCGVCDSERIRGIRYVRLLAHLFIGLFSNRDV